MLEGAVVQVSVERCHGFDAPSQMEKVGYPGYSNRAGRLEAPAATQAVTHGPIQPAQHCNGHHQNALCDILCGVCFW